MASPRPSATHTYRTSLRWSGSTAEGYKHYDRAHDLRADPADATLALTADPAFLGDPTRLNPEQLLVAAASSCQLLSFLAVAAGARIDVVDYTDEATATMPEDDRPVRITQIVLHPTITVLVANEDGEGDDGGPSDERLTHLCEVAHRQCFIANSLRSDVIVEPTFVRRRAG